MDFVVLVQSVGFPIAITLWFMLRTEKVIQRNTDAFIKLTDRFNLSQKRKN